MGRGVILRLRLCVDSFSSFRFFFYAMKWYNIYVKGTCKYEYPNLCIRDLRVQCCKKCIVLVATGGELNNNNEIKIQFTFKI